MPAFVSLTGEPEVHKMLAQWMEPQLTKRAQRATKAGANVLKSPLKAAAGRLSKRMAKSVYVHVAKRDKPAMVVGHHRRVAFFWHMVIGGTRDHGPRKAKVLIFRGRDGDNVTASRVRGIPPHPIVAQVAAQYGDRATQAVIADLSKED